MDRRTDRRTDAGRWPVTIAPPEHVVLRWAKNADENFNFDENFSKRVENIVGREEIARNEQFLLFPQCLIKTCYADT